MATGVNSVLNVSFDLQDTQCPVGGSWMITLHHLVCVQLVVPSIASTTVVDTGNCRPPLVCLLCSRICHPFAALFALHSAAVCCFLTDTPEVVLGRLDLHAMRLSSAYMFENTAWPLWGVSSQLLLCLPALCTVSVYS